MRDCFWKGKDNRKKERGEKRRRNYLVLEGQERGSPVRKVVFEKGGIIERKRVGKKEGEITYS